MNAAPILDELKAADRRVAAELRPPRAELDDSEGMDAWIDLYHSVRQLTRAGIRVFITDSAVGTQEENNLRHLVSNLGQDVSRQFITPFLTSKHSLEFCVSYAEQAWQHGFGSLVVLGGDKTVGRRRCVEHAEDLRGVIRTREPRLTLGGWANPHADPGAQAKFLVSDRFNADFYLTQIVSHHTIGAVERFQNEAARAGVAIPGMFGVFYYRSANIRTLETLARFMPVPLEGLRAEFAQGLSPVDICARTVRALDRAGLRHYYVSNLPSRGAAATMAAIMEAALHAQPS